MQLPKEITFFIKEIIPSPYYFNLYRVSLKLYHFISLSTCHITQVCARSIHQLENCKSACKWIYFEFCANFIFIYILIISKWPPNVREGHQARSFFLITRLSFVVVLVYSVLAICYFILSGMGGQYFSLTIIYSLGKNGYISNFVRTYSRWPPNI